MVLVLALAAKGMGGIVVSDGNITLLVSYFCRESVGAAVLAKRRVIESGKAPGFSSSKSLRP
jgi:hypothetical protein